MSANTELAPRPGSRSGAWAVAILVALLFLGVLAQRFSLRTATTYGLIGVIVASALFVIWRLDPVLSFTLALLLAPLSSNWEGVGIPGILSPNRIILAVAVAGVLLRAAPSLGRPVLRIRPVHWLMAVAGAYAVVSAVLSSTLLSRPSIASLGERFGIIPFLAFVAAPAVFRTERDRRVLLVALVVSGGYLGLTALFETIGLRSLVFPSYINDRTFGILPDRARGPFVEPAQNGLAMFACLSACVIAIGAWRSRLAKLSAIVVLVLCAAGVLFTLTRAVWIGAAAAVVVTPLVAPRLRRFSLGLGALAALVIAISLAVVPGLSAKASDRRTNQGTVYDRYALNRAALNMIEARPLVGFGWGTYFEHNRDYLQIGEEFPLPIRIQNVPVHNLYLGYAAELGLVGTAIWLSAMALAVGGALFRRGSPDIQPWRWLLLAVTICYLSLSNFEPTTTFSTLLLLLLAGVVNGGSPGWAFDHQASPPGSTPVRASS